MIHTNLKRLKHIRGAPNPILHEMLRDKQTLRSAAVQVLKDDRSALVVLVEVAGLRWVVKRSNVRGVMHALKWMFRRSRASKQFQNAEYLLAADIPTARPIAAFEDRMGWLRLSSYYVSEYIPGCSARDYFETTEFQGTLLVRQKLVGVIKRLHAVQLSHRDLNLSNIIIDDGEPKLIDLDRMCKHRFKWKASFCAFKDFSRLLKNWKGTSHSRYDEQMVEWFSRAYQGAHHVEVLRVTQFQKG